MEYGQILPAYSKNFTETHRLQTWSASRADAWDLLFLPQSPDYSVDLIVDMLSRDPCRHILVPAGDRLYDRLVLVEELRIAFFFLQILDPIAVHLLPQIIQKLYEPAVVR